MTDVLIIGAGPAGLAAALQLQRRGVDLVIFERRQVGGLLNNANLVENYPGFPGGIAGEALVARMEHQVAALGVEVTHEEVRNLNYAEGQFKAETKRAVYWAPVVVIASGTVGITPEGIHTPAGLEERVLTEILTIKAVTGKKVVIVGAGDQAFDYALNLGRRNQLLILNRSNERKCLPLLWERASWLPDMTYREQIQLVGIEADEKCRLRLITDASEKREAITCDYLVYAIGRQPKINFLSPNILQIANELEQQGVLYRIGDVKNGIYRQVAIAVGDGILAAMQIIKNMEGRSA
jgi:thioredoxin reductase